MDRKGRRYPHRTIEGDVSNLGMFGIRSFSSIINGNQAGILSVGEIFSQYNGEEMQKMISISLTLDHRVTDGAVGASFLQFFKKIVENPTMLCL